LSRHLANPISDKDKGKSDADDKAKDSKSKDADKGPLAERDYELYEAFNMLKGMVMLNNKRNVAAP
jgi:hypothetical protein